jgi:hypothetical protein
MLTGSFHRSASKPKSRDLSLYYPTTDCQWPVTTVETGSPRTPISLASATTSSLASTNEARNNLQIRWIHGGLGCFRSPPTRYLPPESSHRFRTRVNIDESDDPKIQDLRSKRKSGLSCGERPGGAYTAWFAMDAMYATRRHLSRRVMQ